MTSNYQHLSNGMMYDASRMMLIELDPELPSPQNRKQRYIERVHVLKLKELSEQEIEMLLDEARKAMRCNKLRGDLDPQALNTHADSKAAGDRLWRETQSEYYWSDYNVNFHTTGRKGCLQWCKEHWPARWHALFPNREQLIGVKRWMQRKNRHEKLRV
ncbi:MAG: hypothetical protein VW270_24610 [Candidatus Poseidoniales archaeon]